MRTYTDKEIQIFLDINDEEEQKDLESLTLKKLLHVKDKISIFKGIETEELKAIIFNLKFMRFEFKDYIIHQDDNHKEIFYIIEGECQVFHDKHKVGKLKAGEIFGEAAAIFGTNRNASVVCSSKKASLLSFGIDEDNIEFCAPALAQIYKNLAFEINAKLEDLNLEVSTKPSRQL